jgi:hypothetical protein
VDVVAVLLGQGDGDGGELACQHQRHAVCLRNKGAIRS